MAYYNTFFLFPFLALVLNSDSILIIPMVPKMMVMMRVPPHQTIK